MYLLCFSYSSLHLPLYSSHNQISNQWHPHKPFLQLCHFWNEIICKTESRLREVIISKSFNHLLLIIRHIECLWVFSQGNKICRYRFIKCIFLLLLENTGRETNGLNGLTSHQWAWGNYFHQGIADSRPHAETWTGPTNWSFGPSLKSVWKNSRGFGLLIRVWSHSNLVP